MCGKKNTKFIYFLTLGFSMIACMSLAQSTKPGTPLAEQKKAQILTLAADPDMKSGKATAVFGSVDTGETRFMVQGLDVRQPISVTVYADDPKDALSVKLVNPSWADVMKEDNTSGKGIVTMYFRVFNEFGIILKSKSGRKNYHLLVWAGDAVKYPAGGLLISKKKYEEKHGSLASIAVPTGSSSGASGDGKSFDNKTLVIILVAIAILLGSILGLMISNRRKAGKSMIIVWLISCATTLYAQQLPPDELHPNPPGVTQTVGQFIDGLQHSQTWAARSSQGLGDLERLGNLISSAGSSRLPGLLNDRAGQSIQAALPGVGRLGGQIAGGAHALQQFTEVWPLLNPDNRDEEPDLTPSGQPELPTMCEDAENPDACGACYTNSFKHLNDTRDVLEQLKSIYKRTKKLKKKSIAFGDNVSGMTGAVSGLAWQQQRTLINNDYKNFISHYKTKYTQLITELHTALMEINACESEHGLPDWYSRFGFMYYDFMKERYSVDSDDDD